MLFRSETIKDDVSKLFDGFYNGTTSLSHLNYKFIELIPKKKESVRIGDYRQISPVNGIIKIFTRMLCNHLAKVIDKLVS